MTDSRASWAYFNSISPKRRSLLASAMFFAFAAVGFFTVIDGRLANHLLFTLPLVVSFGAGGATYALGIARGPRWLLLAALIWLGLFLAVVLGMRRLERAFPPPPLPVALRVYSVSGILCIIAAYGLFIFFIQTEGADAHRARTELALAHGIQQTLVPVIDTVVAGCHIFGISAPSDKVGGDLVDVAVLPDGRAVAYLADIAGHGLNAGILMGMLKAAVRASVMEASEPQELFTNLNRVLPGVKEAHMYATCVAFRVQSLSDRGCRVDFSIAGQPPVLHLSRAGEVRPRLADQQFPLGLLPFADYRAQSLEALPGDLFVAATDGVLEVAGADGVELGLDGLQAAVAANVHLPLPSLAHNILGMAKARGRQADDQTLLLIRVL